MRDLFWQLQPFFEEAGGSEGGSATNQPGGGTEPPKTFTQDEVDRIVQQRLSREAGKYGDYDQIKANLEKLQAAEQKRKEAEMSDLEKAQAALTAKDEEIKSLGQYKERWEAWEKTEADAIEEAAKDLPESQRNIVNALPLNQRRAAINEFKSTETPANGVRFGKKGTGGEPSTRAEVAEMAAELGYSHPKVKEAYRKLKGR